MRAVAGAASVGGRASGVCSGGAGGGVCSMSAKVETTAFLSPCTTFITSAPMCWAFLSRLKLSTSSMLLRDVLAPAIPAASACPCSRRPGGAGRPPTIADLAGVALRLSFAERDDDGLFGLLAAFRPRRRASARSVAAAAARRCRAPAPAPPCRPGTARPCSSARSCSATGAAPGLPHRPLGRRGRHAAPALPLACLPSFLAGCLTSGTGCGAGPLPSLASAAAVSASTRASSSSLTSSGTSTILPSAVRTMRLPSSGMRSGNAVLTWPLISAVPERRARRLPVSAASTRAAAVFGFSGVAGGGDEQRHPACRCSVRRVEASRARSLSRSRPWCANGSSKVCSWSTSSAAAARRSVRVAEARCRLVSSLGPGDHGSFARRSLGPGSCPRHLRRPESRDPDDQWTRFTVECDDHVRAPAVRAASSSTTWRSPACAAGRAQPISQSVACSVRRSSPMLM